MARGENCLSEILKSDLQTKASTEACSCSHPYSNRQQLDEYITHNAQSETERAYWKVTKTTVVLREPDILISENGQTGRQQSQSNV